MQPGKYYERFRKALMRKAVFDADGWIRCPLYQTKLGRITPEGVAVWCGKDKSEVLIPFEVRNSHSGE
jgi:hypothetical protein